MGTSRWWMSGALALAALSMAASAGADPRDGYRGRADRRTEAGYGDREFKIAFERGYDDGLEDGRRDAERRRRFDPARHDEYRDGDHGYRGRFGSRSRYVQAFRSGFERGYRKGYERAADRYGYGRGGHSRDDDRYRRDDEDERYRYR